MFWIWVVYNSREYYYTLASLQYIIFSSNKVSIAQWRCTSSHNTRLFPPKKRFNILFDSQKRHLQWVNVCITFPRKPAYPLKISLCATRVAVNSAKNRSRIIIRRSWHARHPAVASTPLSRKVQRLQPLGNLLRTPSPLSFFAYFPARSSFTGFHPRLPTRARARVSVHPSCVLRLSRKIAVPISLSLSSGFSPLGFVCGWHIHVCFMRKFNSCATGDLWNELTCCPRIGEIIPAACFTADDTRYFFFGLLYTDRLESYGVLCVPFARIGSAGS